MSLKHGILGLLCYCDMTGYDIMKSFNNSLNNFWQANQSQIYRDLNNMEQKNLVESRVVIQTDKPNKKIYKITECGKKEFSSWLKDNAVEDALKIKNSFLIKMFFSAQLPISHNTAVLKHYIKECNEKLNHLYNIQNDFQKTKNNNSYEVLFWLSTVKYGIKNYQASIDWANEIIKELEEFSNENSCN